MIVRNTSTHSSSKARCGRLLRFSLSALAAFGMALAIAPNANAQEYIYIGDYVNGLVDRFQLTGDPLVPTANPSGAYISPGFNVEGMGGTSSLLAVAGGSQIKVYNTTGAVPTLDHTINTGSLRVDFNPSASVLYATPGSSLSSYMFATGTHIGTDVNPGSSVWGEAYHNGKLYFTTGWSGGSSGVYAADLNGDGSLAGTFSTIIAPGTTTRPLTAAAGITFASDGSFYVANGANGDPTHGFINHYDAAGNLLDSIVPPNYGSGSGNDAQGNPFFHAFDIEIGPDGKLYLAAQQANCITQIYTGIGADAANIGLADTLENDTWITNGSNNNLASTKTLHFTSNNQSTVPEPGSIAMLVGMVSGAGFLARRRRKK